MFDIGPNLTTVLIALISLAGAIITGTELIRRRRKRISESEPPSGDVDVTHDERKKSNGKQ